MEITVNRTQRKNEIRKLTVTAMLASAAFILAFFAMAVPLSPSFAKMDLSDLAALTGAFAFGPVTGIMVELIKNVLQAFSTSTGGIGEFANFLMGAAFVGMAGLVYQKNKTKKGAVMGCVLGSIAMAVTGL